MQLPDDALSALWSLYDHSGIRPEWALPMLYLESGFNPAAYNASSGAVGLAQDLSVYLTRNGVDPTSYRSQSAAVQIASVIAPRLSGLVSHYGALRSATRVYQGNFLPATLPTVRALWQALAWKPQPAYAQNTVLDPSRRGVILLCDVARVMAAEASAGECAAAIGRAYVLRSSAGPPTNATYGQDFFDPLVTGAGELLALAMGARVRVR